MLQSCWQISSKVILLPIHYVICIFINKQVDIYSLAKLQFINNEITIEEGKLKISNEVLLNFDINTSVGDEYIFAQEDIKDFFKKSPEFCNNFINYYFGE